MKRIPNRLWDAVTAVAGMKYPSVAKLLRGYGFGVEAGRMDELTAAFEQAQQKEKERKDGKRNARGSHRHRED